MKFFVCWVIISSTMERLSDHPLMCSLALIMYIPQHGESMLKVLHRLKIKLIYNI